MARLDESISGGQVGHLADHDQLHTRANYWFDVVTDYGAVGDGSTDDSATVQAAIDAAEAAGGGYVYFPTSTTEYMVNDLVVDSDFVSLISDNKGATLKLNADGAVEILRLEADDLRVENLAFDADRAVRTTGSCIKIRGAARVTIRNNSFTGAQEAAVELGVVGGVGTSDIHIENNDFTLCDRSGIRLEDPGSGSHSDIWIEDNHFSEINTDGQSGHASVFVGSTTDPTKTQHVWVRNNIIEPGATGDGVGIGFDSGTYVWIVDNYIEGSNTAGEGIAISAVHVTITGNTILNCVAAGILIWYHDPATFAVEHILIATNRCFSNEHGIALRWAHNNAVIANTVVMQNTCYNAAGSNTQNFGVLTSQAVSVTADTYDDCLIVWNNLINNNSGPLSIVNGGDGGLIVLSNITSFGSDTVVDVQAYEFGANITLDRRYGIINVDTATARVITLPDCADFNGKDYLVRRDGANTVTIDRAGSDTFDDADVQKTLDTDGASIHFFSIGDTEWKIISTEGTVGGS